jgi:hypothetical protein
VLNGKGSNQCVCCHTSYIAVYHTPHCKVKRQRCQQVVPICSCSSMHNTQHWLYPPGCHTPHPSIVAVTAVTLPWLIVMCVPWCLCPPPMQAYISTGRGIKAVVSDAQLLGVLDAIKPSLKHKRWVGTAARVACQKLGCCDTVAKTYRHPRGSGCVSCTLILHPGPCSLMPPAGMLMPSCHVCSS